MVGIAGYEQNADYRNSEEKTTIEFIITKGKFTARQDFMDEYFRRKKLGELNSERTYDMNNSGDREQWVVDSKKKLADYNQRFEKVISLISTEMGYRDIMNETGITESEMSGILEIIAGISQS